MAREFGIALMALVAGSALSADKPAEREHLPSGVTPLHYDLAFVPDAVNLRFHGRVRITVEVRTSTQVIVLNAAELSFDRVVLDQEETEASVKLTCSRDPLR
jgi:aminopeptidase N